MTRRILKNFLSFILMAAMLLLSQSTSLPMFLASAVLYGIGQGAVHTSAQTLAILNAPKNRVGAANATFPDFCQFPLIFSFCRIIHYFSYGYDFIILQLPH